MSTDVTDPHAEIDRLHARIAALEAELVEVNAWANRVVAKAEDRVYWLDRWHIDLNSLMQYRIAGQARAALRAARSVYRALIRMKRRLLS